MGNETVGYAALALSFIASIVLCDRLMRGPDKGPWWLFWVIAVWIPFLGPFAFLALYKPPTRQPAELQAPPNDGDPLEARPSDGDSYDD